MPSLVDQRRLRTGATALKISGQAAETIGEIRAQIEAIHDGIAALQSLDDLGPEANEQASRDERELWKRMKAFEQRLNQLEGKGEVMFESMIDPTTASIEAGNTERDRLRAEVLRLSQALVVAYTDSEALSAERDLYRAEADRLKKIGETMFVEGYDQAVEEIRDHFRKAKQTEIVVEVEKIWMKDKLS